MKKKDDIMDGFYTFNEVAKRDSELFKLAQYEVTGGMLIAPKSMEEAISLQNKISKQFNCFKKQIHSGETTFEYITQQVLSRNGPFPQDSIVHENNVNDLIKNADANYAQYERIEQNSMMEKEFKESGNMFFNALLNNIMNVQEDESEE